MKDRYHYVGIAAATMADTSAERWDVFIGELGSRGAANLLAAIERARPAIEHDRLDRTPTPPPPAT